MHACLYFFVLFILGTQASSWILGTAIGAKPDHYRIHSAWFENYALNSVIIHGGVDSALNYSWFSDTYSVYPLDPTTVMWSYAASNYATRPPSLGPGSTFVWSETLHSAFLYGGLLKEKPTLDSCSFSCSCCFLSPNVWLLDWENGVWEQLEIPGEGPAAREHHVAVFDDENLIMYIHGGMNETHVFDDFWALDVSNISTPFWTQITNEGDGPGPLLGHQATLYYPYIYFFGGSETLESDFHNSLWEFSIENSTWLSIPYTFKNTVDSRRFFTAFTKRQGQIWMFYGGEALGGLTCPACVDYIDLNTFKYERIEIEPNISTPSTSPAPIAIRTSHGLWLLTAEGNYQYVDGGSCGDGTVSLYEDCDDGNLDDGDGCDSNCTLEFCGDGIVNNNGTENCDSGEECPDNCVCDVDYSEPSEEEPGACSPYCGNEVFDSEHEICDPTNFEEFDNCLPYCYNPVLCTEDCECPPDFIGDGMGGCRSGYDERTTYAGYITAGIILFAFLVITGAFLFKCLTGHAKFQIF